MPTTFRSFRAHRFGLTLATIAFAAHPSALTSQSSAAAAAAPVAPTAARGRIVARASAGPDTTQHFAAYLPTAYTRDRKWPAIFVLDPGGRALDALALFAAAAERSGYVVLSTYGSRAGGAVEPNLDAMNAMLAAADTMAIDPARLYIAGMSGTARLGWAFAIEQPGAFAGMFAASAAPPSANPATMAMLQRPTFSFAMTAGWRDFNFTEVHRLAQVLNAQHAPAHVEIFDGPHVWPPEDVVERIVDWFVLREMVNGKRAMDSTQMRRAIAAESARADSLAAHGQTFAASEAFDGLARSFAAWDSGGAIGARAALLARDRGVRAFRTRLNQLETRSREREVSLLRELARLRDERERGDVATIAHRVGLDEIKSLLTTGDSLERPWAERELADARAYIGGTEAGWYLEQQRPDRALLMLEALATVEPLSAAQCRTWRQVVAALPAANRPLDAPCGRGP
jgi:predicted esterase